MIIYYLFAMCQFVNLSICQFVIEFTKFTKLCRLNANTFCRPF